MDFYAQMTELRSKVPTVAIHTGQMAAVRGYGMVWYGMVWYGMPQSAR
jgi:hypothetical protein